MGVIAGAKMIAALGRATATGLEVGLRLPVHSSFAPAATSVWIDALLLVDLGLLVSLPWRWHLNAGFYVDNSSKQSDFTGLALSTRQVEAFTRGMGGDRLRLAIGTDAPLIWTREPVGLWPFAEYHLEIGTANSDPAFGGLLPRNRDRHWFTLGIRARVNARLTLDAGSDVLVRSAGFGHGSPLARLNFLIGVSISL